LPPPANADEADEDQIFWVAFPDEPRAEQGRITLSDRPGLGVSLDESVLDRVTP
jgi:L-alanine-DL-glutamate epimerase-like enolase superfamily enzyme